MLDLVIRNGVVVDGSGREPFPADVGVANGRIVEIGKITGRSGKTIDAEGHSVTPGFIDGHTHMDAQVNWDPLGSCSCWHGVTTVVMGNCGFTLAPSRADERHLVVRNLERAEDIAAESLADGITWSWESFPEYLDVLDALPMGINYVANVGHSALRTWAMGERAFEKEADDDDLRLMTDQLAAALRAGAIGFTTSRAASHETSDDRPVASRLAAWSEVEALVGRMGELGRGIFELTPSSRPGDDPRSWEEEFTRIHRLALDTGVPTTYGLFGSRAERRQTLRSIEGAVGAGARVWTQTHSRGISVLLSLQTGTPFDRLPGWKKMRSLPVDEQLALIADPAIRESLVAEANTSDYANLPIIGAVPRKPDYDAITVLDTPTPPNPSVAAVARQRGVTPVEAMLDLIQESRGKQFFVQPIPVLEPGTLLENMKHPHGIMTFSDSGAHVSQIMDSSIQTHLLAYWVRQQQDFTFAEAIRMITSTPARAWGIRDRGLVEVGMMADLNVIDPGTVGPLLPIVAHDLPGGAKRLKQKSAGIATTIVAGEVFMEHGEHTGALAGNLLRLGKG